MTGCLYINTTETVFSCVMGATVNGVQELNPLHVRGLPSLGANV